MKLNQENLRLLPISVQKPLYDRNRLKPSIIHIGVGVFHRSHQAFYLDELLNTGLSDWGICGMGLKTPDEKIYKGLKEQDYLYSQLVKHPDDTTTVKIIGSIVDYIFVPQNCRAAIAKLVDPQTKIVSLTITEGGYNFDQNGNFVFDNPDVQWDLQHPEALKTVFGLLVTALQIRKERNLPAFTILSCDNIQHNGDVTRKMLLSFADVIDQELSEWIRSTVSFPNCMVDRITPVTTQSDIRLLNNVFGIEDTCPVVCEPFIQWVLEDNFPTGRPTWESAGVQFVEDITAFEKMKIRLLNAGHSFLGFTGSLCGYDTIDESVNDPLLQKSLRAFMDEEVTPILGKIEGINLTEYKDSLIQRFKNSNIRDQLTRICSESSAKLPKFLIPTIKEQLQCGGLIRYGVLVLAAWCYTLELYEKKQYNYPIQDTMLNELTEIAARTTSNGNPAFQEIAIVFDDLASQPRFADEFKKTLNMIRKKGIKETLTLLIQ